MKDLKELISSASWISFDIFDTAILRSVQKPTDLFFIVAELFTQNTATKIIDFTDRRIQAEKITRDQVWDNHQRTEVTIDEIYKTLNSKINATAEETEQLKQLELTTELQCCNKNPFIFELYQYCLKQKKKIIFTSDIYLPEALIQSLLAKAGYKNYKYLFTSSSLNKTKATGALYQHVLDSLTCNSSDILHIGDNFQSDIQMAEKYGIKTYYYKKCLDIALSNKRFLKQQQPVLSNTPVLQQSIYLATLINHSFSYRKNTAISNPVRESFWYEQGYEQIGIFYLGFADWLIRQLQKDKMDKVYFLARDGFIMQKIYNKLKDSGFTCPIDSEYLYASRRALNIPSIQSIDETDINFLISGTSRLTVKEFLNRIGLDAKLYQQQCYQAGFSSIENIVDSGKDYGQLRQLFRLLEDAIKNIASKERNTLQLYFKQKGLLDDKKLAFVDIGWHGSLQRSLKKLLQLMGTKPNIKGYYLGTFPPAEDIVKQGHNMSAYLCEQGKPQQFHTLIKQSVEIFEFIHSAPHGSVIKIENINGDLSCIYDQDIDHSGKLKKAKQIQQGAIDFINDYLKAGILLKHRPINKDLSVAPLKRLLTKPTRKEAINYGNLEHAEGYGDIYIKRFIAKPERVLFKLFIKPHQLLKDYRQSFWRSGFLRRCWFF